MNFAGKKLGNHFCGYLASVNQIITHVLTQFGIDRPQNGNVDQEEHDHDRSKYSRFEGHWHVLIV
jgi:hypothetical protein